MSVCLQCPCLRTSEYPVSVCVTLEREDQPEDTLPEQYFQYLYFSIHRGFASLGIYSHEEVTEKPQNFFTYTWRI